MNTQISANKFYKVRLSEPSIISVLRNETQVGEETLVLSKESQRILNQKLKLSPSFSNKLFKVSKLAWTTVISEKSVNEDGELVCDLNSDDISYIIRNNKVISIDESENIESNIKKFTESVDKLADQVIEMSSGTTKIIFRSENDNNVVPIVIVEMDFINGLYRAYNGIEDENHMFIMEKPSIEKWKIGEFLESFDADVELNMSIKMSSGMNSELESDLENNSSLSVREVLQILRNIGAVVNIDDENGMAQSIEGISESDSDRFVEFFNSFDMPFKSLVKLNYLKKSLRTNDYSITEMLEFLSKQYTNESINIKCSVISDVLRMLRSDSDKKILEDEIKR